jgi:small subunit ribosomal protein S16
MVRIRLRRVGLKKQPSYRIVVADSRSPRDGRNIEVIGFYNPRTEPATMKIQEDRALYWLSVGAQPSDTVNYILKELGTLDRFDRMKAGAKVEELVAEAEAAESERGEINPKTSRPAKPKKQQPVADAVEEAEEAAEETTEEVEPEAEPEAEAE